MLDLIERWLYQAGIHAERSVVANLSVQEVQGLQASPKSSREGRVLRSYDNIQAGNGTHLPSREIVGQTRQDHALDLGCSHGGGRVKSSDHKCPCGSLGNPRPACQSADGEQEQCCARGGSSRNGEQWSEGGPDPVRQSRDAVMETPEAGAEPVE